MNDKKTGPDSGQDKQAQDTAPTSGPAGKASPAPAEKTPAPDSTDSSKPKAAADKKTSSDNGGDAPAEKAPEPSPAPAAKPEPTPEAAPIPAAEPAQITVAAPAGGGRGLAVLAILLALGAAGFTGWLYLKQEARDQVLAQREEALDRREAALDARVDDIEDTAGDARRAINEAIDASRQATLEVSERLADERGRYDRRLSEQQSAIASLEASLRSQRQQIVELRSTDRVDWSLAEAEYLLRLGYQRLLMADDVASAKALLASADGILRELEDTALLPAREAISRDLAALRAVPELDVEGAWLRLQALAGRVDKLILFELPEFSAEIEALPEEAGWRERFAHGFTAALAKVTAYFRIRSDAEPYETLIDPQWEQLVRQNMRMQIAQSQAALLSGNGNLYQQSLENVQRWLGEFFRYNEQEVQAMNAELSALMEVPVSRELPDIGDSLMAVRKAIDERHAAEGG